MFPLELTPWTFSCVKPNSLSIFAIWFKGFWKGFCKSRYLNILYRLNQLKIQWASSNEGIPHNLWMAQILKFMFHSRIRIVKALSFAVVVDFLKGWGSLLKLYNWSTRWICSTYISSMSLQFSGGFLPCQYSWDLNRFKSVLEILISKDVESEWTFLRNIFYLVDNKSPFYR